MEVKSVIEDLPYKIKDINLADSGRDAIRISEKYESLCLVTRS